MTLRGVIVSFIMTIVLSIMVLGYAALQQRIDIEIEATVDSTYRVEITKVQEGTVTGNARSTNAPQYNGLNASFYVGLTNTTDTITFNIEITNYSTVDIKLNELEINTTNNNIKASKSGIRNGDIMLAGSTKNITLKVKYNGEQQQEEQIGTVTLNFNFTRLKGGTGEVAVDNSYSIGDKVTFKGSDWYVIEDSPDTQDYVVLLKENILTNSQLGEYASSENSNNVAFYYSNTCHLANAYGYTERVTTGCSSYNEYQRSTIKIFLEDVYIDTLDETNLKEINGYKIRLIKLEELQNNLGWDTTKIAGAGGAPNWMYGHGHFWTMTKSYGDLRIYSVLDYKDTAVVDNSGINDYYAGVRPVINLYKSAIVSE